MIKGVVMHNKVGDCMSFSSLFGSETVTITNVWSYPDKSIAYSFYSNKAGRNLLKECTCSPCLEFSKRRRATPRSAAAEYLYRKNNLVPA